MSQAAAEILTELQRRGMIVAVDGETLCLKPRSALDDALLARVREAKPAILEALQGQPVKRQTESPVCGSSRCAGCYEVGDDREIHPPKCGEEYQNWLERWKAVGRPQ